MKHDPRFSGIAAVVAGIAVLLGISVWARRTPATVERVAFLGGASGELDEPNFFLEDLGDLQKALSSRGWKVRVAAGTRDGLLPGALSASNAHLLSGARATLEAAAPGQEALILFHSHGREQERYWGQRSHSIVSADRDSAGNEPGFDLDALEPALLSARARGVKVGLVDLSCYSGSTQALQGASCSVTLAASRYVSLCSGRKEERRFNASFFKLPPPEVAVNLEDQFLAARRADRDSINLPQLSSRATPALQGWETFLVDADPLDTFEDLKDLRTGTPLFNPSSLLKELDLWISAQPRSRTAVAALRGEIAAKLGGLLSLRKELERVMPALAKDYDEKTLAVPVSGRVPLQWGPAYLAELLLAARDGHVPDHYTDVQRNLLKAIEPRQRELGDRFAQPLSEFQARRDEMDRASDAYAQGAGSLFEAERKLYELQADKPGPNPCRDFRL